MCANVQLIKHDKICTQDYLKIMFYIFDDLRNRFTASNLLDSKKISRFATWKISILTNSMKQ